MRVLSSHKANCGTASERVSRYTEGREVTAASEALPLEGDELSAIRDGKEPPPESEVEALAPRVIVTDSKGRTVGTRPTLHGIGEHHAGDADNLYVDGCAINAPPKKGAGRPRTRGGCRFR